MSSLHYIEVCISPVILTCENQSHSTEIMNTSFLVTKMGGVRGMKG